MTRVGEIIDRRGAARGSLTETLLEIQEAYSHLPAGAIELVAERLGVPVAQVYSVACFYKAFSLEPRAPHTIRLCTGTACYARGSEALLAEVDRQLHLTPGTTAPDGQVALETVNCPGNCPAGPVMTVNGRWQGRVAVEDVHSAIEQYARPSEAPHHDKHD